MSAPAGAPSGPPSGLPSHVTVISIHPMYSAGQVGLATFLGGPVGGGWLMALNYKRLGEPGKARATIGLSVLAMLALIAIAFATPGRSMSWLAIPPIIAMRALAKSLQGAAYDRHVAAGGSRGSSWRAVGAGLASLAICLGVLVGAAVLQDAAFTDEIMVSGSNVRYTEGATQAEAQAVGDALVELGYLGPDTHATIQVTLDHGRHVVELVVKDFVFSNDKAQRQLHQFADPLSRKAFAGTPVDLWLTDGELEPHAKLTWVARPR